ncbi:DUF1800 domain-containing protein [Nocardioides sp.]|uniref:DUF1800 domain-containing protein n=1 Tax=Nocardioides sp. TaxID=35761 RepID=UPI0035158F0F
MPGSSLSDPARHLADRFTFGVDDQVRRDLARLGRAGWFEAQLRRSLPENDAARQAPLHFPLLVNPPAVNYALASAGVRGAFQIGQDLIGQTFLRRITSRHQVYETMVDFWGNLIYIPASEDRSFPWRPAFDTEVVRVHALRSYRSLLRAAIAHPAMSTYLTNDLNARNALNENLGRELLELYTVGRVYDEGDVRSAARLLTGFTVDTALALRYGYDPARHATGPVSVLGFRHPNRAADGRPALNALLDYLAAHPATATRIATRLCVRFVSDDPDPALVRHVARAYRRSGTDIPATLRALVRHPAFTRARHRKVWNPSDDVVRTARVMGLEPQPTLAPDSFVTYLLATATDMGQLSLRWPAPDGWPETSSDYLSAARVLRSWQHHYDLAATSGSLFRGVRVAAPASQLPSSWPQTLADLVDHQSRRLLGRAADRTLVGAVAGALGLPAGHRFRSAAAVTDSQYTLLRGTVLNSPAGLQR